ncbi:caskin-1 isoform X2 [Gallus gallus]|uniref:CASK interacting protein 1 n=1 Tax=Gallus gallus TaxID=9031 RepID=A0A8V0Z504_CHICK|nr:caskin-1 isoform X2 [Gallus gallus]XP_040539902.1 caskin-1 isoform X2 [Gallus gallus]
MGKDQELVQAVKAEDIAAVQKLLQRPKPGKAKLLGSAKRVNVNFQDTDGFSALHHAALNGNTELISLLLEAQAAVDIKDNKGMRPLHYAAWQGKKEPMKMVLKAGSSVNIPSDEGQIPLHLAAQHGHYDVSEMLLQHQSNPCIMDNSGKTPLDLACEFGRVGVVQLLLNSNMCAALLEPKPGDTTDPNGTSPLHLAAKNGHIDIIRLLLQAGIDINRQTKAGTALHEAALCGKTDVVRLLLDSGINAHVRNTYNQTALDIVNQFTTSQASKEIKQMLRDASAALQVRAVKDYCNNYDLTSLNVKAGDVITVLEQHADGRWKGCIHDNRTGNDRVGYFPSSLVEAISKRTGSRGADMSPSHLSPSQGGSAAPAPTEEIWVLRKPFTGGDRSSLGSTGSVASARSSGSGQSTGSGAHALHAGSEGVKLLATVLSQKASAQDAAVGDGPAKAQDIPAGSSRSQSVASSPYAPQPPAEQQLKKMEPPSEGKSSEAVYQWLCKFQLQLYAPNFINAGYDITTISRMTPEDLTAIGVTKPGHRKKIASEINNLNIPEWLPEYKPANLALWLSMIGLSQYYKVLVENGYENIDFITDITWEDLQEIGITKLGHQKKLMLAVKKLAELQRAELGKYEPGTLKRKAAACPEVLAIESPPPEPPECQSPKMTTFQDSELSSELQVAMTGEGPEEAPEKPANPAAPGYRSPPALGGRTRQMSSSQELLGDGPRAPASTAISKSQEYLAEGTPEGPPVPPTKELRQPRHGHSIKRASVPPVPGKPRQPFPPAAGHLTPPQTPGKPRPPSPQGPSAPHATAKVKPTPQLLPPGERPASPRSLPQSPTHRGFAYVLPQPTDGEGVPPGVPVLPVSVPVLCLPPAGEGEEEPGRPKKRAHSLNRYAASDSEQERDELLVPDAGPYATVQRRVGRSHSVRAPAGGDKNVNRSQSFAIRPKKKGPPPPPPKRSSSAISSAGMAEDFPKDGEGEVAAGTPGTEGESRQEQRRASDLGGSVDTGSAGSVRSIAAMLEMSSIGGGARALALQKPPGAGVPGKGPDGYYLQPGAPPGSPERARVATVLATVKHKEAIGLDGEVVNRRRTISGPVTGLVAAARRERADSVRSETGADGPSERLRAERGGSPDTIPFAEEGNLTIKQRPRALGPARVEAGEGLSPAHRHGDLAKVEASATLKRRIRARQSQQDSVRFILTESDTVKRRPKAKDKEPALEQAPLVVYQNGTGTVKRRPASELSGAETPPTPPPATRPDGPDFTPPSAEPKKPFKPPVSPKPVLTQPAQKVPGPPVPIPKKMPVPSPGSPEVKRVHGTPPPVSPKPTPPPTAPKPPKPHATIQSVSAGSTPTPSPARQLGAAAKPSSTPPSLCSSPAKPLSPGTQPQQVPVKPPRSAIAGPSVDSASPELVQQKLEETSASLAAALQAVEEKIKQEDSQAADSTAEAKSTGSILDDIGSMFDDLADQLDAMLE